MGVIAVWQRGWQSARQWRRRGGGGALAAATIDDGRGLFFTSIT
jgi:hypothetical protein